jgi:N-acylneuraminate cytidylyltransferase
MFAAHSIPILLPRHRVQDIDTPEDWARAELMHAALVAAGQIDSLP